MAAEDKTPENKTLETDGKTPETTPEGAISEELRFVLTELVEECLNKRPDTEIESDYFSKVLEPLFRQVASDAIATHPDEVVEFVQTWVDQRKGHAPESIGLPVGSPLAVIKSWCDRQLNYKMRHITEVTQLREIALRFQMLQAGLTQTPQGQYILTALAAKDQVALDAALQAFGLSPNASPSATGNKKSGGLVPLSDAALNSHKISMPTPASPNAAMAEAAADEIMGEVLRALRLRGVMSASAAFQYFAPGDDGCISKDRLLKEINGFESISTQRAEFFAEKLDRHGNGRIMYRDFRAKISGFLATSRDFHPALAQDELNAILSRVHGILETQGLSVEQGFNEWDLNGNGLLECTEFMAGLKAVHPGLSSKEVAQIFNAMSAVDASAKTTVSLQTFEAAILRAISHNKLKDWAASLFGRLRAHLELGAIAKALRYYAKQPECTDILYSGFSALVLDTDHKCSSVEIGRLWCVLDKVAGVEDPAVSIQEIIRWMMLIDPHAQSPHSANDSARNRPRSLSPSASGVLHSHRKKDTSPHGEGHHRSRHSPARKVYHGEALRYDES